MYKTNLLLIKKCRSLRRKGFTLTEILEATELPKTTVYDHVWDVPLSDEIKKRIQEERARKFSKKRKGKCTLGRIVPKPENWTKELIFLAAHFIFDGEIRTNNGCVYQNRNIVLVNRIRNCMKKIFRLEPLIRFYPESGVRRISYFYVELANYFSEKSKTLIKYIQTTSLIEKRIFLQAFFDDEGCVGHWGKKRLIRGFQHNLEILKLIQKLLKDFGIESRIDEKYKEIVINKKENLTKFRDKINFSKGIYINPDRKNSIWKKKLEKREILDKIINSYRK